MWSVEHSQELAREFMLGMGARWSHVVAVGQTAERLADTSDLVTENLTCAAWLHDVGYAPEFEDTGMHAIDGARVLQRLGVPPRVVSLVAHHTGARFEADERGLLEEWMYLPSPNSLSLDILTLIDLSTGPTGQPMIPADRIAEILTRYDRQHPVHRAVTRSQDEMLASSARARTVLGLPDGWPVVASERWGDPQPRRGMHS